MCQFEYNLQNKLNGTIDAKEVDQQNQLNALNNIMETSETNKKAGDESESGDDENDARSITSSVSISSDESYDSFIEVADVYLEHKTRFTEKFTTFTHNHNQLMKIIILIWLD